LGADIKGEMGLGLGGIVNLPRGDGTNKVMSVLGGKLDRTTSRRCGKFVRECRANL